MQGMQGIPNLTPETNQGQGITGSLVEALAKERELKRLADATRAITLQLETNPTTIVEQNSKEVTAKTQEETAKGIAGVLDKRQGDMQANMNRAAQGPPQGAPQGVPAAGGQMAKFAQGGIVGYAPGGQTSSRAGRALDWVKENPLKAAEYASYGLMLVPGFGLARLGAGVAAKVGGKALTKFAPGLASKMSGGVKGLAKKAFTKPYKAKPGQTVYQNPKSKVFESLDPTKRTAKGLGGLPRSFSPTRTAGTVGTAGYLGTSLLGGQEPEVQPEQALPSAYPSKTPTTTAPAPVVDKKKTGISDEFLATLRGARKGDMTGARMAYKAGQAESELDRLKFQSQDYYRQMSGTLDGLNSLRTQQSKLMKEISAIKLTDPIFQAANKAEKAYQEAVEDGDNSKIVAAKQEVAREQANAMERWAAKYPTEAAALAKLSTSIAEGEARQQSIGKNWYGDSPSPTNSDFKVKKIN